MAVNSPSLILHDAHFRAELGNQITSLYVGVKYCVFQGLSYIYCRVLSIFPTIFILIPEYYGHHTGFIHCSFDWSPKDDHILMVGFLKMTTFWKPHSQYYNKIWRNCSQFSIWTFTQKTNLWKVNFSCSFVCVGVSLILMLILRFTAY